MDTVKLLKHFQNELRAYIQLKEELKKWQKNIAAPEKSIEEQLTCLEYVLKKIEILYKKRVEYICKKSGEKVSLGFFISQIAPEQAKNLLQIKEQISNTIAEIQKISSENIKLTNYQMKCCRSLMAKWDTYNSKGTLGQTKTRVCIRNC